MHKNVQPHMLSQRPEQLCAQFVHYDVELPADCVSLENSSDANADDKTNDGAKDKAYDEAIAFIYAKMGLEGS